MTRGGLINVETLFEEFWSTKRKYAWVRTYKCTKKWRIEETRKTFEKETRKPSFLLSLIFQNIIISHLFPREGD